MKTKRRGLIVTLVVLLCVALAGTATAFAAYVNHQNSQTNTITIGKDTSTIILGEAIDPEEAIYPGESVTFEYAVTIDGYTGADITSVTAELDETSAGDFDVVVTDGEDVAFGADNALANGDTVKVVVTMKDSIDEAPTYDTATLTVTIVIPA